MMLQIMLRKQEAILLAVSNSIESIYIDGYNAMFILIHPTSPAAKARHMVVLFGSTRTDMASDQSKHTS